MKTLQKKIQKDRALSIHVTGIENRYVRLRKRETGLSISDIIRGEYLTKAADAFFRGRDRDQAAESDGSAVQQ